MCPPSPVRWPTIGQPETFCHERGQERRKPTDASLPEGEHGEPANTHDDIEREISRRNTATRKVVVSDSLSDDDLGGWGETDLVRRADAHEAVRRLSLPLQEVRRLEESDHVLLMYSTSAR